MIADLPEGFAWDPDFKLGEESAAIASRVWPAFLSSESDRPQSKLTFEIPEAIFRRKFPAWGIRRINDGALVAYANGVFVAATDPLPEDGWRWAIEAGARNERPNCLCLVVANVDPSAQSLGLSAHLIARAKEATLQAGFNRLIAPVRPSQKPIDTPIEDYVMCVRQDGARVDSWLRAHERSGGVLVGICNRSAIVTASVGLWEKWTGNAYAHSGEFRLERGLAPLEIDMSTGVGTYVEPNVWFSYQL